MRLKAKPSALTAPKAAAIRRLAERDLQVLLGSEPDLARAFAWLVKRTQSKELRKLCKEGVIYTRRRVARVKKALRLLGAGGRPIASLGLDGLIKDAKRAAAGKKNPETDVAILGAIECISHYGLATYMTIDRYLRKVDAPEARHILRPSIKEKRDAIKEMNMMARRKLLPRVGKS